MSYWKKRYKTILTLILPCVAYNLYFLLLLPEVRMFYLIYLDFLIGVTALVCFGADWMKDRQTQRKKQEFLRQESLIYQEFQDGGDLDITKHDITVLEKQLQEQFDINCELQDYIAKWCHEVKIPLSASLLMAEKISVPSLKKEMQEQLERMNLQLKSALLGAKVQSSLFDLQVRETSLLQCVKNSIHNNQFFLIRKHFTLQIDCMENHADMHIYTDPSWLTYVLDQLINNAIKYAKEEPVLKIYSRMQGENIQLCVEDNGEGIKESDIRRIFEKGYTGSSYHNGQYKSTGMGLYMVSTILEKLGHGIDVESEYGKGTRFTITFSDNREYFYR